MRVTAKFCREQEALQHAKALNEPLESRRKIALAAAKAWHAEAILADKRAAGQGLMSQLDADITREFAAEAETDTNADQAD
jgi:hypothetical protein